MTKLADMTFSDLAAILSILDNEKTVAQFKVPDNALVDVPLIIDNVAGKGAGGDHASARHDSLGLILKRSPILAALVLLSACASDSADLRVPALTVPTPISSAVPIAPWAGSPVAAPTSLGDLAADWYNFFYADIKCPLLAPTATAEDIGATGPPDGPDVGTAGGGPFIRWPGDGAPTLFVVPAPLTIGDPELEPFYAESVEPLVYADGSEERTPGDGSSLILLPGVGCGYVFTSPEAHAQTQNFFQSLRVIAAP